MIQFKTVCVPLAIPIPLIPFPYIKEFEMVEPVALPPMIKIPLCVALKIVQLSTKLFELFSIETA